MVRIGHPLCGPKARTNTMVPVPVKTGSLAFTILD